MKTLADFRRAMQPGTVWQFTHHLVPHLSGVRTVGLVTARGFWCDTYQCIDGGEGSSGRLEFPRADEVRIEGNRVCWLVPGSDRPWFTFALVRQPVPAQQ